MKAPRRGSMANAQHTRSAHGTADEVNLEIDDTPNVRPLSEGHHPPILVLSRDANLVETVKKAAPRGTPVAPAPDLDHVAEQAVGPEARRAGRRHGEHGRRRLDGGAADSAFPRAGRGRCRQARGQRCADAADRHRPHLPLPAHAAVARPDAPGARSCGHAAPGPARAGPSPERRRRQRRAARTRIT